MYTKQTLYYSHSNLLFSTPQNRCGYIISDKFDFKDNIKHLYALRM